MGTQRGTEELYDVVAVGIEDGIVQVLETDKTKENAEAIVRMAVQRRGVEEEFFSEVPAGVYKDGDKWLGR